MTGQQLIELIQDNQLESFEIVARFTTYKNNGWGIAVETYNIEGELTDVGHSDRIAALGLVERE